MFLLVAHTVGPCALDYSRTKTQDHFWTDPPADELVQRHRISGHNSSTPPVTRRPALNVSFCDDKAPGWKCTLCVTTIDPSHSAESHSNAGGKSVMQHAEHHCRASCIRCKSQALSRDPRVLIYAAELLTVQLFSIHANRIAAFSLMHLKVELFIKHVSPFCCGLTC